VDLDLILQTLDEVLDEISFAIRFMALFSILTGILVLIGSVIISKYQRMRESVLLRTLGADRRQVLIINVLEYFILGSLASLSGVLLALLASWALAYFSFETVFVPQLWPIVGLFAGITGLTMFIGLINARGILDRPPLEILRGEV
jgi:putative ABC transport system permease protein